VGKEGGSNNIKTSTVDLQTAQGGKGRREKKKRKREGAVEPESYRMEEKKGKGENSPLHRGLSPFITSQERGKKGKGAILDLKD